MSPTLILIIAIVAIIALLAGAAGFFENYKFEKMVKESCTRPTNKKGLKVQSKGEQKIANWLVEHNIEFEYDLTMRFFGKTIRPDFVMFDNQKIIEYCGLMHVEKYRKKMRWKERLYRRSKYDYLYITPDMKIEDALSVFLMSNHTKGGQES